MNSEKIAIIRSIRTKAVSCFVVDRSLMRRIEKAIDSQGLDIFNMRCARDKIMDCIKSIDIAIQELDAAIDMVETE
jgi:hypothetical protein